VFGDCDKHGSNRDADCAGTAEGGGDPRMPQSHAGNAAYVAALLQRPAGWLTWPLARTHGPQPLAHFANQGAIWRAGDWIIAGRYRQAGW